MKARPTMRRIHIRVKVPFVFEAEGKASRRYFASRDFAPLLSCFFLAFWGSGDDRPADAFIFA